MSVEKNFPRQLTGLNELDGLCILLQSIITFGKRNGSYYEILGCLLSIDYDKEQWKKFIEFRNIYLETGGEFSHKGWERATRVYTNLQDRPTKPSYRNRLTNYPDKPRRCHSTMIGINQINKISNELSKKPGFSNLSFVILRPADLYDQFRPGYVPCVIAGDFKFRGGRLDLNVMLRTSDALTIGYADIYYLRNLQFEIINLAKETTKNQQLRNADIGMLNMFLCRTYIQRTLKGKNGININGLAIATQLMNKLQEQMNMTK